MKIFNFKRRKGVLRDTLVLLGTSTISAFFTFLFYLFLGKTLGPEKYGLFGVLLSIFLIVTVYANVIGVVITRFVTLFLKKSQPEKVKAVIVFSFRWITIIGFFIFILMVIFSPLISKLLGLYDPDSGNLLIWPIVFLGLLVWFYMLFMVLLGILNGLQRFMFYGSLRILHTAVILIIGVPMVLFGPQVSGAIFAMFIATAITIPVGIFSLTRYANVRYVKIGKAKIKRFILFATVTSFSIGVLLNGDVIVAKIFFTETNAGFFSALSTMGSISFFITTGLALVAFPKIVENFADGKSSVGILRESLIYAVFICIIVVVLFFAFPKFFVKILFTGDYQISRYLGWFALSKSLLSIANILVVYHMAQRHYRMLVVVSPFSVIYIIMMILLHNSISELIIVSLLVNALLLFSLDAITDEPILKGIKMKKLFR